MAPRASGAAGWNATSGPATVSVPASGVALPSGVTKNVELVTVAGSTSSENTASIAAFVNTPTAPGAGVVPTSAGGPFAIRNVQLAGAARAFPARSVTRVETVTAYAAPGESGADGVNVAVLPATLTSPATGVSSRRTWNDDPSTVSAAISSENVADTVVPGATSAAPSAGLVERTVGGFVSGAFDPVPLEDLEQAAAAATAAISGSAAQGRRTFTVRGIAAATARRLVSRSAMRTVLPYARPPRSTRPGPGLTVQRAGPAVQGGGRSCRRGDTRLSGADRGPHGSHVDIVHMLWHGAFGLDVIVVHIANL